MDSCYSGIRQPSDYVTVVKDRRWASNRITLEFDDTCLFSYIFSTSGQMSQYLCCISGKFIHYTREVLKWTNITYVLSPVPLEWPIRLLCMNRDPSLRNVQ